MTTDVRLVPLDDDVLEPLLLVAIGDASTGDVMPPVPGPPGWTAARQAAFRAFHRARYPGFTGSHQSAMYAVSIDGGIVGMIRLTRLAGTSTMETGIWLGRSVRGRGIGTAALRAALAVATRAGARTVVAQTGSGNSAALGALRACGATLTQEPTGQVRATLTLPSVPDTVRA